MATLTGVHIECGGVTAVVGQGAIPAAPSWSETLNAAGTTTQKGIASLFNSQCYFKISAAVEGWVAFGPAGAMPDASQAVGASNTARLHLKAGEFRELSAPTGSFVAWLPA